MPVKIGGEFDDVPLPVDQAGDGHADPADLTLFIAEMISKFVDDLRRSFHDPREPVLDLGRPPDFRNNLRVQVSQDPVYVRRPEIDPDDKAAVS
jgi:hypothetical protein